MPRQRRSRKPTKRANTPAEDGLEYVQIVPVPETLVSIEPEWRGYLYFVYEDEVVIVNPRYMRIVAVLDA
jgi:hypothetical protein